MYLFMIHKNLCLAFSETCDKVLKYINQNSYCSLCNYALFYLHLFSISNHYKLVITICAKIFKYALYNNRFWPNMYNGFYALNFSIKMPKIYKIDPRNVKMFQKEDVSYFKKCISRSRKNLNYTAIYTIVPF